MPPAGELRVRDITHSTMTLDWDAAPGPVRKYLITYKPESGDAKEVSSSFHGITTAVMTSPFLLLQNLLSVIVIRIYDD